MKNLTRRRFIQLAALTAVGGIPALAACSRRSKRKAVNFFNYSRFIGKTTLPNFERETGIHVNYEVYSSEEEMLAKLKGGVRDYDVIVATDSFISRLKFLGIIDPVPRDRLKNLGNIDPRFRDPVYDPGLAYSIPYLWDITGVGYNAAKLPRAPVSWWILWDEKYKGRISMLDNMTDGIGTALLLSGLPVDSVNPADLAKARDLLLRQRPLLKEYSASTYVDHLASGELWLCQGWNGDVLQAARENKAVDFAVPKEGSFMYVSSLCALRGSGQKEEVVRFLDYLLRPDVAAEIADTVRYATPNEKAVPLLDPELRDDARVFPTAEVRRRLHFRAPLPPAADELWNSIWQEVKVL